MRSRCVLVSLFAGLVGTVPTVAGGHANTLPRQEASSMPSESSREVCTTFDSGEVIRTDCQVGTPRLNPALRGLCTIDYGRRVCY